MERNIKQRQWLLSMTNHLARADTHKRLVASLRVMRKSVVSISPDKRSYYPKHNSLDRTTMRYDQRLS